jgi:hypothetical protein
MIKYLRRTAALQCPIHKAIREEAGQELERQGAFSKLQVLEALRFEAVAEAIRWDYVREALEEDIGCDLVPVVEAFFTPPRSKEKRDHPVSQFPEKYLASGYGKRTAGFVSVTEGANAELIVERVIQRKAIANGEAKALRNYVDAVTRHGARRVVKQLKAQPELISNASK